MNLKPFIIVLSIVILFVLAGGPVGAVDYVWEGGHYDSTGDGITWEDPDNWDVGGVPATDYPDGLDDNAFINHNTQPTRYDTAWIPDVHTSGTLAVGTVRMGVGWGSDVKFTLGGDLTVNRIYFGAKYGSGDFQITMNPYTVHIVKYADQDGTWDTNGSPAWGWTINNTTLSFEGSASFHPRYGAEHGDIFLGDSADDVVTIYGYGNIPYTTKRFVFGPGTTHMNGNFRIFRDASSGLAFEMPVAGTVDGTLGKNYGINLGLGNQTLPTGVFGCQLWSEPWAGGPVYSLSGAITLGAVDLGSTYAPSTLDATASDHPLTVQNTFRLGPRATFNARSSTVSFQDVLINDATAKIQATAASFSVSGNWDSSASSAASVDLGTSEVHFTGAGKTLKLYAAGPGDVQSFFDVFFDAGASVQMQSDLNVTHNTTVANTGALDLNGNDLVSSTGLLHAGGSVTGGASSDITLDSGADLDFGSGAIDIGGTFSAGNGSVLDLSTADLFAVGDLVLTGDASLDFLGRPDLFGILRWSGDHTASGDGALDDYVASGAVRNTGAGREFFTVFDSGGNFSTLQYVPEPTVALLLGLGGLVLFRSRRRLSR